MRTRVQAVVIPSELGEFADDIRRVFLELGRTFGAETLTGECAPALDVFETDEAVEIAMDLPGIDPGAIRIVGRRDALLIVGEKRAQRSDGESTFHLLERGFGRFARVVRLDRACLVAKAAATLTGGELRISVPKIRERRGASLDIPIAQK